MRKPSLVSQLQAIDAAIRMMNSGIKPTRSERDYLADILAHIRARIEASIERERDNGKA